MKIKIPYALKITVKQAKLLARFIDYKLYNPEGRITTKNYSKLKRKRVLNKYWLDKLLAAEWVYKDSTGAYCLRSYDYVWNILDIQKTAQNHYRGQYTKFYLISPEELPDDNYIKVLVKILLQRSADNHRRQMSHKTRNYDGLKQGFLSCRTTAKLFGYKHPDTGRKYRAMLFEVIKSERKVRRTDPRQYDFYTAEFIFPCDKIAL